MKKNYYVSIFTSVSLLTTACSRDDNLDTKNSKSERQAFIIEEAFPDTPKELVTLPSGIQVEKVDSIYILGGDIILTQAQVDSLSRPATRGAIITGVGKSGIMVSSFIESPPRIIMKKSKLPFRNGKPKPTFAFGKRSSLTIRIILNS